jgi:ubiquinone/menaquinone biosynthesis C-methylase UbiE
MELLKAALDLKTGSVIADVGAGNGKLSVALATDIGPTGHLYATEIEPKLIAKITRRVEKAGLKNVTVLRSTSDGASLPAECCDAILMRGSYHHLTDPANFLAGLYRALRPGGIIAVIDFPPSLLLWPWTPKGIPANRGGHGVPEPIVEQELNQLGFEKVRVVEEWPRRWFMKDYCVVFRKPASGANAYQTAVGR